MTLSAPRLLLCFLVAMALLPAAAQAEVTFPQVPVPASDALSTTAHALAVAHWGVDPCAGQVAVTWAHMGAGINARSQWMSVDIRNPLTYSQCSITYNLDVEWDWPKLCTVIEHELGHLSGHDHVDDPHDVMSPYYVYPSPECVAGATPVAAPAPVTTAEAPRAAASTTKAATSKKKKATKHKAAKRTASARSAKTSRRKASTRSAKAKSRGARSTKSRAAKPRSGAVRAAAFADGSRDGLSAFGPLSASSLLGA